MKKHLVEQLKKLFNDLSELRTNLSKLNVKFISRKDLLQNAEIIATTWFNDILSDFAKLNIPKESLDDCTESFKSLLKLGSSNVCRKSSLEKIVNHLYKKLRDEVIIDIQTMDNHITNVHGLEVILDDLKDPNENEYMIEALECVKHGYFRAAVTLGWSAAINRIQRIVEQVGFNKFNKISEKMSEQTKGRFKNFNQKQSVNSINEMRLLFDNVVLWILEGMELIDVNEHTRLKSCFDMRCHAAHPGNAPITKFNVLSFFSDLNEIVFKNPNFKLSSENPSEE